jgi:hypothetical protein
MHLDEQEPGKNKRKRLKSIPDFYPSEYETP